MRELEMLVGCSLGVAQAFPHPQGNCTYNLHYGYSLGPLMRHKQFQYIRNAVPMPPSPQLSAVHPTNQHEEARKHGSYLINSV